MSPEELEAGYARSYKRLFSLFPIWAQRPHQTSAVLPYLAMALLYKRSNFLWRFLIQHRLTNTVWSPLVHLTRLQHLRYRQRLSREGSLPGHLVSLIHPGV